MSRRGKLVRLALGAALLAALAAHYLYWYSPRERAALPGPGDRPEHLLLAGDYDACLWVPFPHQNLGALAGAVEDPAALAAAAARLADLGEPRYFSFGPFAAPPARELALAADLDGGRFEVAARVYPTISVLARLAGKLAGNPWLAGGEVEQGGRRARVEWDGTLWTVTGGEAREAGSPQLPAPPSSPAKPGDPASAPVAQPGGPGTPALAVLRLARQARDVPAGSYRLRRAGAGFVLAAAGREQPVLDLDLARTETVAVSFRAGGSELVAAGPGPQSAALHPDLQIDGEASEPAEPESGEGDRAGLLFDSREALVPRVAVLFEPGRKRWKLPAEGLLKIAGERFPSGEAGGWGIVAIDDYAYERAAPLAPRLAVLRDGRLDMGLWLRPAGARPLVAQVAEVLSEIPLVSRKETLRWQDMALLLEALERFDRVVVEVGEAEGEARVLLGSH